MVFCSLNISSTLRLTFLEWYGAEYAAVAYYECCIDSFLHGLMNDIAAGSSLMLRLLFPIKLGNQGKCHVYIREYQVKVLRALRIDVSVLPTYIVNLMGGTLL